MGVVQRDLVSMSCKEIVGRHRMLPEHVTANRLVRIDKCVAVGKFEIVRHEVEQGMREIPDLGIGPVNWWFLLVGFVRHMLDVKLFLDRKPVPLKGKLLHALIDFELSIHHGVVS